MNERRHLLGLAAGWPLTMLLGGCGEQRAPAAAASAPAATSTPTSASAAASATPAASSSARRLVVGTDAAYAPFESQNEKGEIVGFDIDIVRAVAAKAGLDVTFVNTPWEGIFNALDQGDRDLLVSAITITDARRQTMDFSAPYFEARQLIAVPKASPIRSAADLKSRVVGVQNATTGDEVVSKLLGKTSPKIRRFETTPLALKEMDSGGVEAVVADNGVVQHYVANNASSGLRMVDDPSFSHEQYGIAVRKGRADLLAQINAGLAALKADGGYDAIHARWFGAR